ncbi:hypothetical protein GGR56DRAFT_670312 [Xylariaceae sp. FL0804]|nr:hypothetical protein GGR56DRAFT_670312 [Xylariaceae sp. FL0804]
MTSQLSLEDKSNGGTPARRNSRQHSNASSRYQPYPPPRDIADYASRALPVVPPSAGLTSPSVYSEASCAGIFDEAAFEQVQPPLLDTAHTQFRQSQEIISPQPRYPGHRVLSVGADDDWAVSPVLSPGSGGETWKTHAVSPLSRRRESNESADDSASESEPERTTYSSRSSWAKSHCPFYLDRPEAFDFGDQAGSPTPMGNNSLHPFAKPLDLSVTQVRKDSYRHSDPGTPICIGLDLREFGYPGSGVAEMRQSESSLISPQASERAGSFGSLHHWHNHPGVGSRSASGRWSVSFAVPKIDTFSSARSVETHRAGPPPPLKLSHRAVQGDYVKSPWPARTESPHSPEAVSPNSPEAISPNSPKAVSPTSPKAASPHSPKKAVLPHSPKAVPVAGRKRQSRISTSFLELLRPTASHRGAAAVGRPAEPCRSPRSPRSPGNAQTREAAAPKAKNILSRAKLGLDRLGSEEKKERKREDFKRQIRIGGP